MTPDRTAILNAACEAASQIAGRPIKDGQRLISSGLIDSLSVLRLIAQLERMLNVSIPSDAVQPEDFDDVSLIVETIERVAQPIV